MVISDFCLGLERFWHILLFFPSNLCIPLYPLWLGTGFQRIPLCIVLFPVCLLYFTFCDCVVFMTAVSFGSLSCFPDHVGLILAILFFPLSIFFISVFFYYFRELFLAFHIFNFCFSSDVPLLQACWNFLLADFFFCFGLLHLFAGCGIRFICSYFPYSYGVS